MDDQTLLPGTYGSSSYTVELLDKVQVRGNRFVSSFRLRARFRWSQEYLDSQIAKGTKIRVPTARLLPSYEKPSYGREAIPNLIDENVAVGTNETAGTELEHLLGARVLDYPKPVSLVQYLANSCMANDEIAMDFFAGSGTTGHAVMAQNAADGGNRRYILVQLPVPVDPSNTKQKTAAEFCDELGKPRTIAELTKERLRRAGKKIKEEHPDWDGDTGFRVFKLDSSNIRAWDPNPDDLEGALLEHMEHLTPGRTEQDVLYELLLKLGLDLCVPIETRTIAGKEVHSVGSGVLMACLAEQIEQAQVEDLALGIAKWHEELAPAGETTCIFRDSAFENDVAKVNLAQILEQHGIDHVRSL